MDKAIKKINDEIDAAKRKLAKAKKLQETYKVANLAIYIDALYTARQIVIKEEIINGQSNKREV